MAPMEVPEDAREKGTVYFCYEHANDSFSGVLDDEYTMTDEQLKDYIRYDNPKLYQCLHELPFTGSDVPLSYHAQRQLRKTGKMRKDIQAEKGIKQTTQQAPKEHAYETIESIPQENHDPTAQVSYGLLELQLKRHVQMSLLNGYSLLLRKLEAQSNPCFCNSPTCSFGNLILPDTFYVTLKQDIFPNGYTGLSEVCNETYYCLHCLEDVFDGKPNEMDDSSEGTIGTNIDGIDHDLVIDAATRVYRTENLESINTSYLNEPEAQKVIPDPYYTTTLEIRLKKKKSIEMTLNEVKKFEIRRARSREPNDGNQLILSPSLHITRPTYMEAAKERYKKQGLGARDRRVALLEIQSPSQASPASIGSDSNVRLRCYCREPDHGTEEMVKCDNKWCSIGWFHTRCIGGRDEDEEDDRFRCEYCREDYGPFQPVSGDENMDELTAVNDMILEQADRLADEVDEADEAGEEEDESDQAFDQDSDDDSHNLQTTKPAPWGTPINFEGLMDISPTNEHTHIQPDAHPPKTTQQLDGPSLTPTSTTLTFDSRSSTVFHPPHFHDLHASNLFPGSSNTTFSDLAPFITTAGLTSQETEVFENWKHSRPPSNLVRALLRSNGCETRVDSDEDDGVRCDIYEHRYGEAYKDEDLDRRAFRHGESTRDADKRLSQLLEEVST